MEQEDTKFKQSVGKLLRKARESAKFTQEEAATKMQMSQDNISKFERGKAPVSSYRLLKFSKLYSKPITYFFMTDIAPSTRRGDNISR